MHLTKHKQLIKIWWGENTGYAYPYNNSLLFYYFLLISRPCLLVLLAELKVLFLLKCPCQLLGFCLGHCQIQLG